jgi:tRNA (guanine-N7-)-methyltransferase
MDSIPRQEERRFYGRRKGRKLSQRQLSTLSELVAQASLDLSQPLESAGAVKRLFDADVSDVWLEIGFGAGEHLI